MTERPSPNGTAFPFLHFTRAYGTQLILMPPSDHPCWPKDGEVVPYIFGKANRLHILQEKFTMVKYPYERLRCIHHARSFLPGQPLELQEIPLKFAIEAMERYINWTLRDWREKSKKDRREADPIRSWAVGGAQ